MWQFVHRPHLRKSDRVSHSPLEVTLSAKASCRSEVLHPCKSWPILTHLCPLSSWKSCFDFGTPSMSSFPVVILVYFSLISNFAIDFSLFFSPVSTCLQCLSCLEGLFGATKSPPPRVTQEPQASREVIPVLRQAWGGSFRGKNHKVLKNL